MSTGTIASSTAWPDSLTPDLLRLVDMPTPYLVTDLDTVAARYRAFTAAMPWATAFYAMKCNPAPEILRTLAAEGSSFEVASLGELRALQALGVDPATVLYSNPIKPPAHIAKAAGTGLWRFAFDSPGELAKISMRAPGAAVYVRLLVDDSTSVFPLAGKFGADVEDAYDLMLLARRLGLRPYGVAFHVGSQCESTGAWRSAVRTAGELMARLRPEGIELEMLNLGGGFPARYLAAEPSIEQIGEVIGSELDVLPYRPGLIAAGTGRHLVAESSVLAATVIGRETRGAENWLYLEVGAHHGLAESGQAPGGWDYPTLTSLEDHAEVPRLPFILSGPTCDSSDTFAYGVELPATVTVGDVLYFGSAGAYTLPYATSFNGFPPPTPIFVGTVPPARH
ncbi:type III PLP-dependent enzyme [Actinoplanes sp. KI2]|uniref:type III PLP-dependent enzyme n=1 Tax=Actinoplanes sp. KI2 TaxID=2983315 RepID=UPI0021D56E50|nr:type III PLP-dependent enzyme [Actinoplanes sp. KI2]MCU7725448.1 type III PLP-dependent enzyme [Actinoplanes sp. KI2]